MDIIKPTGSVTLVERDTPSSRMVKHVEDEHQFCPKCGMCEECSDCAIWGCGRATEEPYEED